MDVKEASEADPMTPDETDECYFDEDSSSFDEGMVRFFSSSK